MLPVPLFPYLKYRLRCDLQEEIIEMPGMSTSENHELMRTQVEFNGGSKIEVDEGQLSKVFAILLCPPGGRGNDIIARLNHLHIKTGKYIDVYCTGYGTDQDLANYNDRRQVARVENTNWFFSDKAFFEFLEDLYADIAESLSVEETWEHDGSDKMLLIAAIRHGQKVTIDYKGAAVYKFAESEEIGEAIEPTQLVYQIVNHLRDYKGQDPLTALEGNRLGGLGPGLLWDTIDKWSPVPLKDASKKVEVGRLINLGDPSGS